ncbi:hypothetical protein LINPERHAP2_LOCUS28804 [Linum perenne]
MNFSMDFFNPAVAALTMKHVVYTNDHMRDSSHRAIYNQFYYDRDILHQFFLTRVLLPRSLGRDLVTPLDTWLIHCATMGILVNFCCLMFATMANYGILDYEGSLPFGPQICSLIAKLGIPLKYNFSEATSMEYLRAQHVLRRVGWSKCVPLPVNVSGGEIRYNCSGMDADVVNSAESDERARLTVWCDHDDASDFVESPDYHI